jgi:hypothetical protein
MTSNRRLAEAARAWRTLHDESIDGDGIVLVRQSRNTTVYRLSTRGGPIIAKRCPSTTANVERTIYEQLLTRVTVPTLTYHGALEEPEGQFCWLFVEDAGGDRYEEHRGEHRAAAARWLGALHYSIKSPPAPEALPSRSPCHYRQLLESALELLRNRRHHLGRSRNKRRTELDAVVAHCARLSEVWPELEHACDGSEDTLVHGDIVTHNARLRKTPEGLFFLPFDWEKAGWGSPAEDLSSVDLDAYRVAVDVHRRVGKDAVKRVAGAGKIFRCLVFLEWLGPDLATGSAEAFEQLGLCRSWLDTLLAEQPWIR